MFVLGQHITRLTSFQFTSYERSMYRRRACSKWLPNLSFAGLLPALSGWLLLKRRKCVRACVCVCACVCYHVPTSPFDLTFSQTPALRCSFSALMCSLEYLLVVVSDSLFEFGMALC